MHVTTKAARFGNAFVMAGLVQATGAAAAERGYIVVNTNDSRAIQQVWSALAGEKDPWQEAQVDRAIRPNTQSTFTMSEGSNCLYDIKVKFSHGVEQTFDNVNVCRTDKVIAD